MHTSVSALQFFPLALNTALYAVAASGSRPTHVCTVSINFVQRLNLKRVHQIQIRLLDMLQFVLGTRQFVISGITYVCGLMKRTNCQVMTGITSS